MREMVTDVEGAVRYACVHGNISERNMRMAFPSIELFCAQNLISVDGFMENVLRLTLVGVRFYKVVAMVKGSVTCT